MAQQRIIEVVIGVPGQLANKEARGKTTRIVQLNPTSNTTQDQSPAGDIAIAELLDGIMQQNAKSQLAQRACVTVNPVR
jgi:hypothetical protein